MTVAHGAHSAGSVNAVSTTHYAVGIVLAAIVALWVLGLLVFKGSNN